MLSARVILFDDDQYLMHNHLVRHPSWNSAKRFLEEVLSPSTVEGYYQPLAMISLMLDCAAGGSPDNLRPFHRTSLALHVVNTMLVVVLVMTIFDRLWPAAIVGLLFGLHPMTVEPIAWVGDRKTLLAAFFALGCVFFYLRYARARSWLHYAFCLVCFVLALMSKPTTTLLPVGLAVLDFWPLRRLSLRALIEKVPLLALACVSAVITMVSQSRTAAVGLPDESSRVSILLGLCHNIVFYPAKIVWPANLSSYYPQPDPMSLSHPAVLAGVMGTVVLLTVLLVSLRWTRALIAGWLFFFIVIFPTMGGIGFTNVIAADKYAYLPSVGLLLILAGALSKAWPVTMQQPAGTPIRVDLRAAGVKTVWGRRAAAVACVAAACMAEGWATRQQLVRWQDGVGYLDYMLALAPNSAYLQSLLGTALADRDDWQEAMKHHMEAIRLMPKSARGHNNLAISLVRLGRVEEGISHYREALRLRPGYREARYNLATALANNGRLEEAVAQFTELLRVHPNLPEVHNNFGVALNRLGRMDQAETHFAEAVRLGPEYGEAQNNLGFALANRGRFDEAIVHYLQALKWSPKNREGILKNLGVAYASAGRLSEAETCYEQVLRLRPTKAETHNDLGVMLARQGRLAEAIAHFQEALRLRPDLASASDNLRQARALQGSASSSLAP